jgi:hypothetical protein
MALTTKNKRGKEGRALAEKVSSANFFADDLGKIMDYVRGGEGTKAEVIRTLISEAVEAREGGKEVAHHGEKRVRRLHLEAVAEGTKDLQEKVDELLIIARRGEVSQDKIANQTADNFGLNFEVLKLVEGIFSMLLNDVTKPRLLERLKEAARVEETVEQMSARFEGRAVEKVERVRKEVRKGAKAAS